MKECNPYNFLSHQLISGPSTSIPEKTLDKLLKESTQRYRYHPAIISDKNLLNYADFENRALSITHVIKKRIGKGTRGIIGVHLNRSADLICTIYAIWKLGCTYLPLSRDIPRGRNSQIANDCLPILIITDDLNVDPFYQDCEIIIKKKNTFNSYIQYSPNLSVQIDDPCYVMYTSGSTGSPKGVEITHSGICNRLLWMKEYYSFGEQDSLLVKAPINFDVSVWEMFFPLLCGGKIIITPPGKHADTDYIIDTVYKHEITFIHFVPEILREFISRQNNKKCHSLKTIVCGGESWQIKLAKQCKTVLPDANIYNGYGPTETSIGVTTWLFQERDNVSKPPIGIPISNVHLAIVNEEGKSTNPGEVGELWIGGISVSPGYIGNAKDMNNTRFVKAIVDNNTYMKFYCSGDLVRQLDDGNIDFIGRKDNQIKINGTRIELEEIESIISTIAGINRVIAVKNSSECKNQLSIYYTTDDEYDDYEDKIISKCCSYLPAQSIPETIKKIEKIPVTPNGKIDRNSFTT